MLHPTEIEEAGQSYFLEGGVDLLHTTASVVQADIVDHWRVPVSVLSCGVELLGLANRARSSAKANNLLTVGRYSGVTQIQEQLKR